MQYQGVLQKMQSEMGEPIQYYLLIDNDFLNVNQILDKHLQIDFIRFQCLRCGEDLPIYRQGFCQRCFFETPLAGLPPRGPGS